MELFLGGCYQGKLDYVKKIHPECEGQILEGCELSLEKEKLLQEVTAFSKPVINHFHEWVKRCLAEQAEPEKLTLALIQQNLNLIIISDEVGNGIVPMDAMEREYRERTGRIQIMIAERAERVERVLCGMGQRLK